MVSIGRGDREGCILSSILSNTYSNDIMWDALKGKKVGVNIGGRNIDNIWFTDDTNLLTFLQTVNVSIAQRCLLLNTKNQVNGDCQWPYRLLAG